MNDLAGQAHALPPGNIEETNTMALLGFIFSFIFPLLGMVFSIIGIHQIRDHQHQKGRGLAIAGLVISIVLLVLTILYIAVYVVLFSRVMKDTTAMQSNMTANNASSARVSFSASCTDGNGFRCRELSSLNDKLAITLENQKGNIVFANMTLAMGTPSSLVPQPGGWCEPILSNWQLNEKAHFLCPMIPRGVTTYYLLDYLLKDESETRHVWGNFFLS